MGWHWVYKIQFANTAFTSSFVIWCNVQSSLWAFCYLEFFFSFFFFSSPLYHTDICFIFMVGFFSSVHCLTGTFCCSTPVDALWGALGGVGSVSSQLKLHHHLEYIDVKQILLFQSLCWNARLLRNGPHPHKGTHSSVWYPRVNIAENTLLGLVSMTPNFTF